LFATVIPQTLNDELVMPRALDDVSLAKGESYDWMLIILGRWNSDDENIRAVSYFLCLTQIDVQNSWPIEKLQS
jgi:hypothetical protein